jgi:hypothetical protein
MNKPKLTDNQLNSILIRINKNEVGLIQKALLHFEVENYQLTILQVSERLNNKIK